MLNIRLVNYIRMLYLYFYHYSVDTFNHMIRTVSFFPKSTQDEVFTWRMLSRLCLDQVCFKRDPVLPGRGEKCPDFK